MQNCVSILEGALQLLTKLNTFFPNDLSVHMNVYESFIHNCQKVGSNQEVLQEVMDK